MTTNERRLATLVIGAAALLAAGAPSPAYTVITRGGHRIEALGRPEIRGLQAYLRLQPGGALAVIQEEKIDWPRTEAANPPAEPTAVRAGETLTEGQPAMEAPGRPIELKILGGAGARAGSEPPARAGEPAPRDGPSDPMAREALLALQAEYAKIRALRDDAVKQKSALESELAALQARLVGPASQDTSGERKVRDLRDRIAQMTTHVGRLEGRLEQIRAEALQHGGSVD